MANVQLPMWKLEAQPNSADVAARLTSLLVMDIRLCLTCGGCGPVAGSVWHC